MRNTSFASMHCSLAQSLELIGDWWTPPGTA
ncbi:DNA-binding HxlR family transcriptional regulator [Kribbella solani]|uniref:DNA-binding HxlR family transcriptional regulator n=1 Tax=Kribbella solani TaxID=236067 RepID=A0A841DH56_9ACTN|nr:DNA-binding HxlR family transcriptional regulator [Kribbella solani]